MNPYTLNSNRRSGDYVVATIAPANRVAEPHFGLLDSVIVGAFLALSGVLLYLVLG
jgi:hypothetical protein